MSIADYSTSMRRKIGGTVRSNPVRDWFVLLAVLVVALGATVLWNIWVFETVATGGALTEEPSLNNPVAGIGRPTTDTVRGLFEKRAAEAAKHSTGEYRYADPSQQ